GDPPGALGHDPQVPACPPERRQADAMVAGDEFQFLHRPYRGLLPQEVANELPRLVELRALRLIPRDLNQRVGPIVRLARPLEPRGAVLGLDDAEAQRRGPFGDVALDRREDPPLVIIGIERDEETGPRGPDN